MSIQQVQQENSNFAKNVGIKAVAAGLITASVERLLLPAEVKSAIHSTRLGEDAFMKETMKNAEQIIKNTRKQNITQVPNVNTFPVIDVDKFKKVQSILDDVKNICPPRNLKPEDILLFSPNNIKPSPNTMSTIKQITPPFNYNVKNMPTLDLETIRQNAKKLYPELKETAKEANLKFIKTFTMCASIVVLANVAAMSIIKSRQEKQ